MMTLLRITEVFYSLQGESTRVGLPTVFVRLTGCPLRCQYCDTAYAFHGGEKLAIQNILAQVAEYNGRYVCVTGGEPLAQPGCLILLKELCDAGYEVSLETSGALSIADVDPRVMIIMDIKTPGSLESEKNQWTNLDFIKSVDQLKFVLCSQEDYKWSCAMLNQHNLLDRVQVLFSPSWGQLDPDVLANWIVEDRIQVRFQLQLHKILWHDNPGH